MDPQLCSRRHLLLEMSVRKIMGRIRQSPMVSHAAFGFSEHRFRVLWNGVYWTANVYIPPDAAYISCNTQRANLRVSLQPNDKVVLLQMKVFRVAAMIFPQSISHSQPTSPENRRCCRGNKRVVSRRSPPVAMRTSTARSTV